MFCKKGVLKNFASFSGKHLCWSHFLIKFQAFRPATFKKRFQHRCFLKKFAKFLRTPILKNICERLLLLGILFGRHLPHSEIVHEDKDATKSRMMLGTSSKTCNFNLINGCLVNGRNITPGIFYIILRFRLYLNSVTGDIPKAIY